MKFNLTILSAFIILASCNQVRKVSDALTNPSAKAVFERGFKDNDAIFQIYNQTYHNAKSNNLELELPSVLQLQSDTLGFKILAYTLTLKRGERFRIESNIDADSLQLAIDLYSFTDDSVISEKPLASNSLKTNSIRYDVTKTGVYKIVILPYRKHISDMSLKLFTEPSLIFPVSGKDNNAIQSFWGATRDGGTRAHEGIDIFAKRGTPVVAATNGFISNTGNRGLGGKQVWLRDGVFGQSLYYAHLDSVAVSGGARVKTGDTLGFVENTGNAKTTSPHLHFGIYASGGAVDPLPFVKITPTINMENISLFKNGETQLAKNELRIGADARSKKIETLESKTPVEILAKTRRWFHIRVSDTLQGFMHDSLIKELESYSN